MKYYEKRNPDEITRKLERPLKIKNGIAMTAARPCAARRSPRRRQKICLEGRNAVQESAFRRQNDRQALRCRQRRHRPGAGAYLRDGAQKAARVVVRTDRRKLDQLSATGAHQGVIAMVAAHAMPAIGDILKKSGRGRSAPIILCDDLSDPHNLGAIIRRGVLQARTGRHSESAEASGSTAVVNKQGLGGALDIRRFARVSQPGQHHRYCKRRASGSSAPRRTAMTLLQADLARSYRHRQRGRGHEPPGSEAATSKSVFPCTAASHPSTPPTPPPSSLCEAVRQRG